MYVRKSDKNTEEEKYTQIPKISLHQNPNSVAATRFLTLDDMDGHIYQYSSDSQLPPSDIQGTHGYVPYLAENTFSQQHLVKLEDHASYSLPQWTGYQHLAPNYVDYLLGNDKGIPYGSTEIGCSFPPKEYFLSMDAHQAELHPYQVPNEVVQHQPNMSASTSKIPTKSRKTCSRKKAYESDRRRRTRISAALDALGHLLPQSKEGSKANVIDDCIDYIKYLQLHMRELSQNRLREPTSNYLLYLEGCGAYLVHENTATGPLQDMLGKLLDENPSEVTKLLESRDLFMMPTAPN
uniref:Putative myc-type, basic helix-loop-helix (BHLH) domain-containing protein n=1 Tax=Helianthus annuus TaxID=4232 RepID=A0A251TJ31_HELAN